MNTTAVRFQALPPLNPDEYAALEQSILAHGVLVPILVDDLGVVIDGHHRQKIAKHHELPCPHEVKSGFTDSEKRTLSLSLNLDRRHLTREQRRALVAESIKADPDLSNLEHAKRTGVTDKTVDVVRRKLASRSEIPNVSERVDTLGRRQPASKPTKPKPELDFCPDCHHASHNGFCDLQCDDCADTLADELIEVEYDDADEVAPGLTGRQLSSIKRKVDEPTSPLTSSRPRRKPLGDQANEAGWEIRKAAERISRILIDDRLDQNKKQVRQALRGHLLFAQETVAAALESLT
jgi:hypothetical protein